MANQGDYKEIYENILLALIKQKYVLINSLYKPHEYAVVVKAVFSANLKALYQMSHKFKTITYVYRYTFFISDYLQSFLNPVNKITFRRSLTYDSLSIQQMPL